MGIIYLAQPIGNRVRSIDRLKPKDRKKPANCNNSNVKFGKHLSNYSDLKDRYERLVGDVDVRVVVNIPDNQIQEFENILKKVFVGVLPKLDAARVILSSKPLNVAVTVITTNGVPKIICARIIPK